MNAEQTPQVDLFGVPVAAVIMEQAVATAERVIDQRSHLLISVVNASKLVQMRHDAALRQAVLAADVILADGMSVVWAVRLLGGPLIERIAGIDLMTRLLDSANRRRYRVYFLGATDDVLALLVQRVQKEYPNVVIAGQHNGYFGEEREEQIVAAITAAQPDILFAAMGTPKKERFLARWAPQMGVPVCHGVGGAFDVLAGKVHRAPLLWQRLGFEWLYRVFQEPRRLWRRYLITNTIFACMVLRTLLAGGARPQHKRLPLHATGMSQQAAAPSSGAAPGQTKTLGLIYVLAASHSGSTLLALLLGTHRDTCSVGELNARNIGDPDRYRCSCGALIRQCTFWKSVRDRMAALGTRFEITDATTDFRSGASAFERRLLRPLHRGPMLERLRDAALHLAPGWRRRQREILRCNRLLIQTVCELCGAQWVVDGSKIGIRLKYLLQDPGLNVRVVHLVRDGRAVALTYRNPDEYADARDPQRRGGGSGAGRPQPVRSMRSAAREWRRSNEEAECILHGLDRSRWIEVRYEALCADVQGTLGRIFHHFQLDPERRLENFRERCAHVIGNGMRFDDSLEIKCDERWRDVLTAHDLEEFDAVAGALNHRYGYA